MQGFDNYLKPPGLQKVKKGETADADRLFSTSSVTFQQVSYLQGIVCSLRETNAKQSLPK